MNSSSLYPLLLFVHVAGIVVWVGGMFFAYQCLRPVAAEQLEPPVRLRLWRGVFARFFPWVWAAVALIFASGMSILAPVGMASAPLRLHLMMTSGLVMMAIYGYVFFGPYGALKAAVAAEDWKTGGAALARIRRMVGINILLGLLTIAFATLGRWPA